MFYQMHTDRQLQPVDLAHRFAGPMASSCWLIGGGPSLAELPIEEIARTPTPRMAINLAGTHLLRPTFWTAYDPSSRFHRSVYLDPSIMKFVPKRRGMDLVPGTTFKVCESPNLFVFEQDKQRGFANFVHPLHQTIIDWADSFVQAIDILYQLGFRKIYLAGCDMQVHPSESMKTLAQNRGLSYDERSPLRTFVDRCRHIGLSRQQLDELERPPQYHFDEDKPLMSAVNTDMHYFKVVQFLRLSRRAMSLAGLELISVTPGSRLNDHFRYQEAGEVCRELRAIVGDPSMETTRGRYTRIDVQGTDARHEMKDLLPPGFNPAKSCHSKHQRQAEPVWPDPEVIINEEG